jgi:NitT/TauT family transport system permease protein
MLHGVLAYYPLLLIAVLWEALTAAGIIGTDVLPRLDAVLVAIWRGLTGTTLLVDTGISLFRVLAGLAAGLGIGIALGVLTGLSRRWDAYVSPLLIGSQAFPRSALLPLFIVWFGLGEFEKLVVITSVAFFPVFINTYEGLKRVNVQHIWSARAMGYRPAGILLAVQLPSTLPYIMSGIRIAAPTSVTMMVVAEMVGARSGLGQLVITAGQSYRFPEMFAGVVLLGVVGLLVHALINMSDRLAIPWNTGP